MLTLKYTHTHTHTHTHTKNEWGSAIPQNTHSEKERDLLYGQSGKLPLRVPQ